MSEDEYPLRMVRAAPPTTTETVVEYRVVYEGTTVRDSFSDLESAVRWIALLGGDAGARIESREVITSRIEKPWTQHCPDCGATIKTKMSGVECSAECGWWYCA